MNIANVERWYALQLRTRWESSTAALLSTKGYQTFLPTSKTLRQVRGTSSVHETALFPGYVFCRFNACNRLPVLATPGVIAVVGRGRIPLPVEDSEIESLQRAVSTGLPIEAWPFLEVGQMVRIEEGALAGIEGILTGFKGIHRIVLSVSLLRRSVALEVHRSAIRPSSSAQATEEQGAGVAIGAQA